MIENVLNPEEFERQGNHENVVRGIAALNDMKSTSPIDSPCVEKLPKKSAAVFVEVPQGTIAFSWHRMAVDMNSINNFMSLRVALAPGTQYVHFVPVLLQRGGLLPDASVEGSGQVLYDDKYFSLH